jgi:hypothetical protein
VRVEKSTHRVRNGALIGLAAGAGFGVLLGVAYCSGDEYCEPYAAAKAGLVYGGLGAAAGAAIGGILNAARESGDVLYDSRPTTPTVSVAPILSPTRKGALLSMTWR